VIRVKRRRSQMYTILPMVARPLKECGCEEGERRRARPPVAMGRVYHAHVKCSRRARDELVRLL